MHVLRLVEHATQSRLPLACMLAQHQGEFLEHSHDCFELVYVLHGRGRHLIDGRPYPILAGDFYVMRPGDGHRYVAPQDLRIYNVLFQQQLFTADEWRELSALPGLAPFLVGLTAGTRPMSRPTGPCPFAALVVVATSW